MPNHYLQSLFKKHAKDYNKTDKMIANYFLDLGSEISNKTLAKLADEIDVSKTTIFNFVTRHGFDGFQSFKIEIARNITPANEMSDELVVFSDISAEDTPYTIAQKTVYSSKALLDNLLHSLSDELLNSALELIENADTLHFFGQASASIIAYDSYHKFIRTKHNCNYIFDHHIQLSYSTKLDENDCVFLFSHSGQTIETITLAKVAKEKGAKVIVLTGYAFSELIKYADVSFVIDSEETELRSEMVTSRYLYLAIIDVLYTSLLYRDEETSLQSIRDIREVLSHTKVKD